MAKRYVHTIVPSRERVAALAEYFALFARNNPLSWQVRGMFDEIY